MENLGIFYKNKKVLVTGATGFKGSWLCSWLLELGSKVYGTGYSPNKNKKLFYSLNLQRKINLSLFDIREFDKINNLIKKIKPQIIFHLAAQPLVYESFLKPKYTFEVNLLGTLNILEASKNCKNVRSIICVTTDKVYDHINYSKKFKESDRLGGDDPYSLSKASSELIIKSYREIFKKNSKNCSISSVRAGNVIGGGDWSDNRLVPDCIKSIKLQKQIVIRNPGYVRPWQHVLDPLKGYLVLAKKQITQPKKFSGEWNFGPSDKKTVTVLNIAELIISFWGKGKIKISKKLNFKENKKLILSIEKARKILKWNNSLNTREGVKKTIEWYFDVVENKKDPSDVTKEQIKNYMHICKIQ